MEFRTLLERDSSVECGTVEGYSSGVINYFTQYFGDQIRVSIANQVE